MTGTASAAPELPGDGLVLRPWRADDPRDLAAARLVLGDQARSAEPWLAARNGPGRDDWAVLEAGEVVGHVALRSTGSELPEIGYRTAPVARGRGIATSAARTVARFAFDRGAPKVVWRASVGNEASWRVAHAVGFRFEGRRRAELPAADGSRADAWSGGLLAADLDGDHPLPWGPDPVLVDGEVVVRRYRETDVDDWLAARNEPDVVARGFGGPRRRALSRAEAWTELLVESVEGRMTGQALELGLEVDGRVVGNVSAHRFGGGATLGWWTGAAARGRGATGRGARLLVAHLESVGVERVEARIHVRNVGSQRVAEGAGLQRVGVLPRDAPWDDGWGDSYLYVRDLRPSVR